jgi:hypothetical protein
MVGVATGAVRCPNHAVGTISWEGITATWRHVPSGYDTPTSSQAVRVFLAAEPAQWHWPFPLSRTSPLGAAVNSHVYARSISCRRSTPWRPVILTLLVGLGLRNL